MFIRFATIENEKTQKIARQYIASQSHLRGLPLYSTCIIFLFMSNYSDLLRHPNWQKKRLEILQRDGFKCQYCNDTESELHVHHLHYSGKPWEAHPSLLITLCKDCHEYETKYYGDFIITLKAHLAKMKQGTYCYGANCFCGTKLEIDELIEDSKNYIGHHWSSAFVLLFSDEQLQNICSDYIIKKYKLTEDKDA